LRFFLAGSVPARFFPTTRFAATFVPTLLSGLPAANFLIGTIVGT